MHPAQHHVDATKKRQKAFVEGRTRRGATDRPGKRRAFGGAAEKPNMQSTVDSYPTKDPMNERASGGGIHIKPSHRGMLHAELGVPQGKKIPAAKLEAAKAHAGPAERKRITFAENASKWGK